MENVETQLKTVKISEKTHSRLEVIGSKGQTFDDVINDLLNETVFIAEIEPALERAKQSFDAYVRNFQSGEVHTKMVATLPDFFRAIEKFIETVKAR